MKVLTPYTQKIETNKEGIGVNSSSSTRFCQKILTNPINLHKIRLEYLTSCSKNTFVSSNTFCVSSIPTPMVVEHCSDTRFMVTKSINSVACGLNERTARA